VEKLRKNGKTTLEEDARETWERGLSQKSGCYREGERGAAAVETDKDAV
jgi:hypothetical protein